LEESLSFQAELSRLRRSIFSSKLVLSYIECFLSFSPCRCEITTTFLSSFTVKVDSVEEGENSPRRFASALLPQIACFLLGKAVTRPLFPPTLSTTVPVPLTPLPRPHHHRNSNPLSLLSTATDRVNKSTTSTYNPLSTLSGQCQLQRVLLGRGGEGVPAFSQTGYGSERTERLVQTTTGQLETFATSAGLTLSRLTDLPTTIPTSACVRHVLESYSLSSSSTSDLGRE
jgi:hypothetical protein